MLALDDAARRLPRERAPLAMPVHRRHDQDLPDRQHAVLARVALVIARDRAAVRGERRGRLRAAHAPVRGAERSD